jgi:hypothetical protein
LVHGTPFSASHRPLAVQHASVSKASLQQTGFDMLACWLLRCFQAMMGALLHWATCLPADSSF